MAAGVGSADRVPTVVQLARGVGGETANRAVTRAPAEAPPAGPTPAAGPTASGIAPAVVRLRLGRFDAPATDAVARMGVPEGVPLAVGFPTQKDARSLSLTREGLAPFRAAGVTWTGPADGISVAVRSRTGTDPWRPWQAAAPAGGFEGAGPAVRQGGQLVWLGVGDAVEVTVTSVGTTAPDDVAVDLIDPREAPGDAVPVPSVTTASVDASRVGRPPIHSRAEWAADERLMNWPPQYAPTVRALAWHDQSVGGDYAETDVPGILRALFYYDAVSRGWGDVGDNVLVDRFGRLWEGRYGGLSRAGIGAHTPGRNVGTAGIGVLGGPAPIQASTQTATPAVEAVARYVAWKLSIGPAVDPRGDTTLSGAAAGSPAGGSTGAAKPGAASGRAKSTSAHTPPPATTPRVFGTDEAVAAAVLPTVRDRAYALMGAWTRPQTMRRTLAMWNPARATLTELGGATAAWAGQPGDVPVPADYDGDGQLDIATWSPATGVWTIQNSSGGTTESFVLGQRGDVLVPADYDGDGRAEPATFTPTTATWHVRGAADMVYGRPGDRPVPADYTGDGRADPAVYRAKSGLWEIRGIGKVSLGSAWHVPVPADYDGDGKAEPATFSPQSGRWYVRGKPTVQFGAPGDVPVPGQYDGDGKADLAVWRPPARGAATGTWIIRGVGNYPLGTVGDVPTTLG
ncbi:MAG: hypothetical protein JWP76_3193 [Dactylosporangium sp.]|nr:hypothetical protein [Dactylosporangium sp.]